MSTCRWAGSDRPRSVKGRHEEGCADEACWGCAACNEAHCRVCRVAHTDGTCAECMAETRGALWQIVNLTGALPAEAIAKGVDSEAAMLWGPATDWERWGHVQASIRVGRLPADWCEVADNERHPLFVLGQWDACVREVLDHDEPAERVTIGEAAKYLDMQLTYLGSNPAFDAAMLTRFIGAPVWHHRMIDVSNVAMAVFDWDRPKGLADVASECRAFGYDIPRPDHTAEGDVRATRAVYEALRAIRAELTNPADLHRAATEGETA